MTKKKAAPKKRAYNKKAQAKNAITRFDNNPGPAILVLEKGIPLAGKSGSSETQELKRSIDRLVFDGDMKVGDSFVIRKSTLTFVRKYLREAYTSFVFRGSPVGLVAGFARIWRTK
jgi:hypothetical protein